MAPKLETVHAKGKRYDWGFDYARPDPKFPTRYIIPPNGKDPFRIMMRGYASMEAEKDNRVYGGLDSDVRYRNANVAEPRFMEAMKFAVPAFTDAEYQAVTGAGFLVASVKNQEMRQGFAAQMLDEVRHTQLETGLRKYYLKNYHDPAGFDIGQIALGNHPVGTLARASFQPFNTGDPVEVSMCLNVVLETAYTNPLVVALPQVAVANGDHAMPTTFLSIQSDESRHMANGYGTLMCVVQEPDNVPFLQESLERHFWHQHMSMDTLVGVVSEYYAVNRPWAYKDVWEEWVVDDFVGSYMSRLRTRSACARRTGSARSRGSWTTCTTRPRSPWPPSGRSTSGVSTRWPGRLRVVREPLSGLDRTLRRALGCLPGDERPVVRPDPDAGAAGAAAVLPGVSRALRDAQDRRAGDPNLRPRGQAVRRLQRGLPVDLQPQPEDLHGVRQLVGAL